MMRRAPPLFELLCLGLTFFLLGLFSITLTRAGSPFALAWFANAVGIAYLSFRSLHTWPAALLTLAISNLGLSVVTGETLLLALRFLPPNLIEILSTAALFRWTGWHRHFSEGPEKFVRLILLFALLSIPFSSAIGALLATNFSLTTDFFQAWLRWYQSDMIGAIAALPFALALHQHGRLWWQSRVKLEGLLFAFSIVAFNILLWYHHLFRPIFFLFPLLLMVWRVSFFEISGIIFFNALTIVALGGLGVIDRAYVDSAAGSVGQFLPMVFIYLTPMVVAAQVNQGRLQADRLLAKDLHQQRVIAALYEGVLIYDAKVKIIEMNATALQLLHLNQAQLFGQQALDPQWKVVGEDMVELTPDQFPAQRVLRDGKEINQMVVGVTWQDGSLHWLNINAKALTFSAENQATEVIVTFFDITERKRLDRMKSAFISTVSHELRTPLTSIRGSLGMLAAGLFGALPKQAEDMITVANRNSERLLLLVNDILDMDKLLSGKVAFRQDDIDLPSLIQQALVANAGYAASFDVRFLLASHPEHAIIIGDRDRLMQVMANLLSNAAKYSPAKDTVEVRIIADDAPASMRVEVEDHGPGVPLEFQSQLFSEFAQANSSNTRQQGGTGLGLNITRKLVEHMGGTVGFSTELGVKTIFWFTLPISDRLNKSAEPAQAAPAKDAPDGRLTK